MSQYIPKWHRELDIFHRIKPLLIIEGNVLDVYQYPEEGSAGLGSVLRLTQYLHYYLQDCGYQDIVFFEVMIGQSVGDCYCGKLSLWSSISIVPFLCRSCIDVLSQLRIPASRDTETFLIDECPYIVY